MQKEGPQEIKARHLARKAVVYVRQSTDEQVLTNTGSTDYQRDQIRFPRAWGWPEELIETIEADLGLSGAAPSHRPGYQRLVREIECDQVGAMFLADLTRGGRDALEWFRLLSLCQAHDTLIVIDGKVYDPNNSGELLMARLLATLAEHDNLTRRETLQRGRLTKASKGVAVSAPPTGYVRDVDGTWLKDPDPNVQGAIAAIIRTFRSERSCGRTVVALKHAGVKLPRRRRTALSWAEPTVTKLYRVLTNPAYAGIYRYRRTVVDPRAGRDAHGRLRTRRAADGETIIVRDHHEPYVSIAEWEEIQTVLKLNGPSEDRRNLGPGLALVQGIIRCGVHRFHAMTTVYKADRRDGGRFHSYYCIGDYHDGGPQCGRIAGFSVDAAVTEAILARLTPPRLEVIRAALNEARSGERSEQYRRKLERDRMRREITVLEEKFFSLEPSSVALAKDIERRLETRKRELTQLERLLDEERSPASNFDDDAMAELIDICRELRTLWEAPTTTIQDRKQIARLLIRRVVMAHRDDERFVLNIEWADGGAMQTVVTTPRHTNRLVLEMSGEGLDTQAIADELNARGIRTLTGRQWTRNVIAKKILQLTRGGHRRRRGGRAA